MNEKPPSPEKLNRLHEEALELDNKINEPVKNEQVHNAQEISDRIVQENNLENNKDQEICQSEKELQKTAQEILDESIAGKTEIELTQEQKEAEDKFCQENLEKLIDLINDEKVMLHLTSGKLSSVLEQGLFSRHEIFYKNKLKDQEHIRKEKWSWQKDNFEFLRDQVVMPYVNAYRDYLEGKLNKEELDKIRDDLLNIKTNVGKGGVQNIPKIGRKRVLFFMEKTIPEFVEKEIEFHPNEVNFESVLPSVEEFQRHEHVFKTNKEENIDKRQKDADLWQQLINIMGGNDLISANPSAYLKNEFADWNIPSSMRKIRPLAHFARGLEVFFDTPQEIRLYDLGGGRGIEDIKNSEDVAVSNRVTPNHFRAIRFGVFDKEKRILYITDQIDERGIDVLSDKQKNNLLLFDTCTIPIPPIKSIKLSKYEDFDYHGPKTVEQKDVDEIRKHNSSEILTMLWDLIAEKKISWGKVLDDFMRVHWRPRMERKRKKGEQ